MQKNLVNSQLLDQPVDTTNALRNKENTIMQLRKSVARFAALSAIVIAIAGAGAPADAQVISGTSLLNSNRSSWLELTCPPPPGDVTSVTLFLSNSINFPLSGTYSRNVPRPTNGWGTTYPFLHITINGSASTQSWYGFARYYRPSGNYDRYANPNPHNVYSAGPAGNLSSASFSPWSTLGGDVYQDRALTLTVTLDNPAQVGGQWVDVNMPANPYARFWVQGWNGFWIPGGQRSGSQSYFITTDRVRFTNRIITVNIGVNGTWGQTTFQVRKS